MEIKTINQLIKELEEIKEKYGNINYYNINFYIEKNKNKFFLTI